MTAEPTCSYEELGAALAKASSEAREHEIRMQVIEIEVGRFKIVRGNPPWSPKLRAYIDHDGVVCESFFAFRKGFRLPPVLGQ